MKLTEFSGYQLKLPLYIYELIAYMLAFQKKECDRKSEVRGINFKCKKVKKSKCVLVRF